MKSFEAKNGNFETSAVVKNHRMKQREQRSLGDCWQWKGDNCSFRHDMNKRAKSTQPNPSPSSTSPNRDADLVKSALMHIVRLMNSPAKGLKKW